MKQATTPTIRLTTDRKTDFNYYEKIWINLYDTSTMAEIAHRDKDSVEIIDKSTIKFTLTQEEANAASGKAIVEMRVKYADTVIGFKNTEIYIKDAIDKVIM